MSLYNASIPGFIRYFGQLSHILDKAQADAEGRKIDPSVFINARLAPDMFPLARQIQIASDVSKGFAARAAGIEIPSFADTETTFEQLHERINKTVDFLKSIKPDQIDGKDSSNVTLKIGGKDTTLKAADYLFNFALPNFFFHVTTAYGILRHNGVGLGKADYQGAF